MRREFMRLPVSPHPALTTVMILLGFLASALHG
jgi:hypothetical protein